MILLSNTSTSLHSFDIFSLIVFYFFKTLIIILCQNKASSIRYRCWSILSYYLFPHFPPLCLSLILFLSFLFLSRQFHFVCERFGLCIENVNVVSITLLLLDCLKQLHTKLFLFVCRLPLAVARTFLAVAFCLPL
uniref:Uncharacterized protein n=1 Tax=Cacopsylla melanoneura TaxID=428564 RepID=A0A8D9BTQ8_9HEMI